MPDVGEASPTGFAHSLRAGLRPTPIADPLDRRNAAMLRILLVFMGVSQPLITFWFAAEPGIVKVDFIALALAAMNTAIVWCCFFIAHTGRFRLAANLFVTASLLFLAYGYLRWGFAQQARFQLGQVYPVLVGGLLLRRRVLWLCTGALLAIFAIGAWRDLANVYYQAGAFHQQTGTIASAVLALLAIALILDRAVTNLRESLGTAVRRGNDLARLRDRMQLEIEEKERSREQMLHAQKMQAIGRLASGIAHDFNHLLSLILGYARRGRDSDDTAALKQSLVGVESAARRAAAVSHKLLNFAREDSTRAEAFDSIRAIEAMRPVFAQLFDPRTRISYELSGEDLVISFDRVQFELMLLNLAANANQAMPDGGSFRIGVKALRESGQVEIEMIDSGHGMTAEVKRRIFEPFFTTRPVGEGTGLGLPAVQNLVALNGGALSVESEPGAGATFRIRLPRVASLTASDREAGVESAAT